MDTNIIIAIASVFIAVCALGVTVWQGMETRKHNKNSIRPLLNVSWYENRLDTGGDNMLCGECKISNRGFGLAIVKSFILFYEGKEVARNNNDAYCEFLIDLLKDFGGVRVSWVGVSAILKAEEEKSLWKFVYNSENDSIDFIHKLSLLVEYESIYQDETFILDNRLSHEKA